MEAYFFNPDNIISIRINEDNNEVTIINLDGSITIFKVNNRNIIINNIKKIKKLKEI